MGEGTNGFWGVAARFSGKIANAALLLTLLLTVGVTLPACSGSESPEMPAEQEVAEKKPMNVAPVRTRRLRPPVNTTRNMYEGSMWRGAASWGNLLRDHRARYAGDLLTVTDLGKIFKVPELKPEQTRQGQLLAQPQEEEAQPAEEQDPLLAYLRQQQKLRESIDREQNEILRSIDTIEMEVVRVLSNGNLLVRGVHPPIFRERNRVKYVVSLTGIVRPSDVDDKNTLPATKISKAEYKVRRLVKRSGGGQTSSNGQPNVNVADRMANFVTGPKKN